MKDVGHIRIYAPRDARVGVSYYASKVSPFLCDKGISLHQWRQSLFSCARCPFHEDFQIFTNFYGTLCLDPWGKGHAQTAKAYLALLRRKLLEIKPFCPNPEYIDEALNFLNTELKELTDSVVFNEEWKWVYLVASAMFGDGVKDNNESDEYKYVRNMCVTVMCELIAQCGVMPEPFFEKCSSAFSIPGVDSDSGGDDGQIIVSLTSEHLPDTNKIEWDQLGKLLKEIMEDGGQSKMRVLHNYFGQLRTFNNITASIDKLETDILDAKAYLKEKGIDVQKSKIKATNSTFQSLTKIYSGLSGEPIGLIAAVGELVNMCKQRDTIKLEVSKPLSITESLLREKNQTGYIIELQRGLEKVPEEGESD